MALFILSRDFALGALFSHSTLKITVGPASSLQQVKKENQVRVKKREGARKEEMGRTEV